MNCMNNAHPQQVDGEHEEEVIEEVQEHRNNDESEDSNDHESDIVELEIDETMNEVFGALFD